MAERLIPDPRLGVDPLAHPKYAGLPSETPVVKPTTLWPGVSAFLLVFSIPVAIAFTYRQPSAASSITPGDVTQAVAAQNRQAIESTAVVSLPPNSIVKLDKTWTPTSGQLIDGRGAVLVNAFDSGSRTLTVRGDGLGYLDWLTVTGPNEVTLKDKAAADNYKAGQPCYLYHVDGFADGTGQLRTLRDVVSSDIATGRVVLNGPSLDKRLTGGKWFSKAASVGNVAAGRKQFNVPAGTAGVGNWVLLTEGPSVANEGRDEWHRIVAATSQIVSIESPTQRSYSAAVLARAQPIANVVLKNLTLGKGPSADQIGTTQLNYAVNWRLDNCVIQGTWNMAGSAYFTFANCAFDACDINSCHDCTFINCRFVTGRLEECCFNLNFVGCTWYSSFGANTACEQLTLRGCRLVGSGSFIGLDAPRSLIDSLLCESGTSGVYLMGDNWTVRNVISDDAVWPQTGVNTLLSNVKARWVLLGLDARPSGGVVIDTPHVTVNTGAWKVLP